MSTASRGLTSGERRSLLVVYDVLHFVALNGPSVTREEVVDYLHRATSRRDTAPSSRLRAFERLKQSLKALSVEFRAVASTASDGPSTFMIERPTEALERVSRLLDKGRKKQKAKGAA